MIKTWVTLFAFAAWIPAYGQDKSNDILLVSVGESADRYSEVAVHLQGLLAGTDEFSDAQVDIVEDATIESLADGYYDQNPADVALRSMVAQGYRYVLLIPTLITTPNGTIEYREFGGGPTDVYDDAPLDNEYFAPEVFYEGCTQFSKLILNAGTTPMIFLPDNADEEVNQFGEVMYRVANGVGLELIPGAYALDAAGTTNQAEQEYLYACSIFTKITGLQAGAATYSPPGISSTRAAIMADAAQAADTLHHTNVHYSTSYENDGAVVYRSLDVANAPFNNVVRYMYKGSSTHDWTSDALTLIINSNVTTTAARRKLGIKSNGFPGGTRYWHPDDFATQGFKFDLEPDEASFMYVSGSWEGAYAQDTIDRNQTNMVPMAFDWIKSFAIGGESGTASTLDALDYHSCVELYFNYAERGWKLIPLTIGMGRINESVPGFVASDDGLHCSDPLVYMNAYMMLSSALGTQFPLPAEVPASAIHRGSYTTAEIHEACLIGHDLIKELAFLSETSAFVPDSDLSIVTKSLPVAPTGAPYTNQLSAAGGDGAYTWELIPGTGLPEGLALSTNGVISGIVTNQYGSWNVAFQVTDGAGAFRKVGLKLSTDTPVGDITLNADVFAVANTNYGTNVVATLYSAVQTAPDGLATFRIAISVDPMADTSITSAGGLWGINSGEGPSGWWNTFDGSLTQSVDSVSNIQVVDFNAHGGDLSVDDFTASSFRSVTVHNGANSADRVKVVAGGVTNAAGGQKMATSPATIDLQALAGSPSVSSFTLANGNPGNAQDRWNIGGIQVEVTIHMPFADGYAAWVSSYGLVGTDALPGADVENGGIGDGYVNQAEFALGMNPTVSDAGSRESVGTTVEGGTNFFEYIHYRRSDHVELGLSYLLIDSTSLVDSITFTNRQDQILVGGEVGNYEPVTNRYVADDPLTFLQLQLNFTE